MVRRATPDASSLEEANKIVRGNWLQAIERHHLQYSGNSTVRDILDVGCSVGVSTRFLADKFPSAKVTVSGKLPTVQSLMFSILWEFTNWSLSNIGYGFYLAFPCLFIYVVMNLLQGLDLSPYFLAVAQFKEKERASRKNLINWVHANGEDSGLPSKSFDIASMAYVVCLFWLVSCMNTLYLPLEFCQRFTIFLNELQTCPVSWKWEIFNAKSHALLPVFQSHFGVFGFWLIKK